jgi:hypothetical protein
MVPVGAIVTTLLLGLGTPATTELVGVALVIAGLAIGLTRRRSPAQPLTPAAAASSSR